MAPPSEELEEHDLEWEEWDGSSPFIHHCIAGSIAGVAEHVLLFPVDTVKTHMQAYCSVCPNNPDNIASSNSSMKSVCTGPPRTQNVSSMSSIVSNLLRQQVTTSASTTSASVSSGSHVSPHGMWSTMSNLISHGHSIQQLKHTARQSGTLTSTMEIPSEITQNSKQNNNMTLQQNIRKNIRGYSRLWRGVQTMATGCIPAHALYFSSYEYTKSVLSTTTSSPKTGITQTYLHPLGASVAGAISALFHDLVMTPMDTIKQRMQLGHYESMTHAFRQIVSLEGWGGLYRSFNVTVMTNLPYGMIMVSTNEFLRGVLLDMKRQSTSTSSKPIALDLQTTMLSGCGAGMIAAAVTAPLDRVKTRLQTQRMLHSLPPSTMNDAANMTAKSAPSCPKANAIVKASMDIQPHYNGFSDAFSSIVKEEGYIGLWRGLAPRLMTHTPAVAISWTAYEGAKRFLHDYCL